MGRAFGLAMTVAAVLAITLLPAYAEGPMSPVYPTGPGKPAPAAAKEKADTPGAKEKAAAPAAKKSAPPARAPGASDAVVATAPIPPPANDEAEKNGKTETKEADKSAESPSVKRHKRPVRRRSYARRYRGPYPWPYYGFGAETTGWGGGQFGPSPYSATGQ